MTTNRHAPVVLALVGLARTFVADGERVPGELWTALELGLELAIDELPRDPWPR